MRPSQRGSFTDLRLGVSSRWVLAEPGDSGLVLRDAVSGSHSGVARDRGSREQVVSHSGVATDSVFNLLGFGCLYERL